MLTLIVMIETQVDDQTEAKKTTDEIKSRLEGFENLRVSASVSSHVPTEES